MQKYLEELNPNQLKAAQTLNGPVLIQAGAGSGKTKTVIARIHNLIDHGVNPTNILAITFTNKAANELKERLPKEFGNVTACTIHSLCVKILRKFPIRPFNQNFTILDTDDQKRIIKNALDDFIKTYESRLSKYDIEDVKRRRPASFFDAISRYKQKINISEDKNQYNSYMRKLKRIVAENYSEYTRNHNMMDFDDLLFNAVESLHQNQNALKSLQNKYTYISVDEYQDVSEIQEELIEMLADTMQKNICVVGDPNQSIYAFRGAKVSNILEFPKRYKNAKVISIMHNYRSTPEILALANDVISHNPNVYDSEQELIAVSQDGKKPVLTHYTDNYQQAELIVEQIKNLLAMGKKPKDIAILYRNNSLSRIPEKALVNANIPYQIIGGVQFYERAEIKDLLAYLRLIANPADDLAFSRIVNTPSRHIGNKTLDLLERWATFQKPAVSLFTIATHNDMIYTDKGRKLQAKTTLSLNKFVQYIKHFDVNSKMLPSQVLLSIIDDFYGDYLTSLDEEDVKKDDSNSRYKNALALVEAAKAFESKLEIKFNLGTMISEFLQETLLDLQKDDTNSADGAVQLMTVHASKGLEFDTVFLINLEDGVFPSSFAKKSKLDTAIQEERRLMYVALTRAKRNLFMTNVDRAPMYGYGELIDTTPSMFIDEFEKGHYDYVNLVQPRF